MVDGKTLATAITLEDDDDDDHVPGYKPAPEFVAAAPTTRSRVRQTLDEDGFEELRERDYLVAARAREKKKRDQAEQARVNAGEQAAARERERQKQLSQIAAAEREKRKQKGVQSSKPDRGGSSSLRKESVATERDLARTPSEIPVPAFIDLSSNYKESATLVTQNTQQHSNTPVPDAAKASSPTASTFLIPGLPERSKPLESSNPDIPIFKAATPLSADRSPSTPRLPDREKRASLEGESLTVAEGLHADISSSQGPSTQRKSAMVADDGASLESKTATLSAHRQPADSASTNVVPAFLQPPAEREPSEQRHTGGAVSSIGEFAEYRAPTISGRVNTTLERAERDIVNAAVPMSAQARRSHGPSVAKFNPKQKAIKSVRREDDCASRSHLPVNRQNQHPANDPNRPPTDQEDPVAESSSIMNCEPSRRWNRSRESSAYIKTHIDPNLTQRLKTWDTTGQQPSAILPDEQGKRAPIPASSAVHQAPTTTISSAQPPVETSRDPNQISPKLAAETATMLEPTALGTLQQGNKEETQAIKVDDYDTARTAVEDCLRRHVEERHETHAYLTWSKMWRQRTCQEQELRAQAYKRKGPSPPTLEEKYVQHVSPFAAMSPIQIPFDKKSTYPDISQAIFTKSKPKDTVIRSALVVPTTKYKSDAVNIPPFKEYVSLKHNILADNESKLLATPYFPDDEEEDSESRKELIKMLPKIYEMTHDQKGPLDLRKEQCKFYKDSIEAFLGEIGISWNDILYWLLGPEATIRLIVSTLPGSRQFEALYDDPHNHEDTFERDGETRDLPLFDSKSKKWQDFFLQLKEPTTTCLRLAAIACAVFFQECDFSIWYLARQSDLMQRHILRKTKDGQTVVKFTYRQAMCTVCHQHNCLLHGELREEPSESVPSRPKSPTRNHDNTEDEHTEEDDRLPAHHHDDSDFEKVINYKLPANPDAFNVRAESEAIPTKRPKPPNGKFNPSWWLQRIESQRWGNRKPFFPCNHDSSCEGAQCRCYMEGTTCEKTCKCSPVCNRRFPGCSCAAKSGKRVCISDKCFCMKFDRECDADLCGSCGATDILDPVNRYNEDVLAGRCGNVAIQRGVPRKTQLAHSRVHGFGLCMGEDIKIDEYIGEYTGETITISEGARRMEIYHHQKTMYLFTLNLKQEVDATYMGNKLRFINNADDKNSNCYPKNLLCNTVFRLALYAKVDIKAGAELYFNYNYPKELTETFKQPDGKTVAVKQTAKQKGKGKSSSSNEIQSVEDRPHTLASTAKTKARADRIEKRAAMQAKKSSQNSAPTLRPGPQRARKTAISEPDQQRVSQLLSRGIKSAPRTASRNQTSASEFGRDLEASNHDVPPVAVSQDTQATRSTQVVQDTDEEEDDLIPENNTQEDANEEDIPISDAAQDRGERRKAGILRRKQSDMAPVIRRKGGPRPRASRKRKRVVFDDSDED